MRATEIIQRQFQAELAGVHLARMRLVFTAVFTALRCGHLSLTALGRAIAERTTHKHGIKRIDRLLGNAKLHEERVLFYRAVARRLIAPGSRPLIIIDWTAVTPNLWALVAAVSFQGRALTVYAETHPISRYLKPYVNDAFLDQLAAVLPNGTLPIILADAGFRSPFMRLIESRGWDYVIRVRGHALIQRKGSRQPIPLRSLFELTPKRPEDFGQVELGTRICNRRYATRLVGVRRPVRHRKYHPRVRDSTIAKRERRAAHEPWILATSLHVGSARVVAIYARRMQIEETFRDAKSSRFGMSLDRARTSSEHRANTLLLLASLAHLFAILLGLAAESARLHRGYQANTVVRKRVLSLAMVGRLLVGSANDGVLGSALTEDAWTAFRMRVSEGLSF